MIFHIAQETDWTAAQSSGAYKASSLAMEGFIHCSDQHQVLEVAHRLFQNRQDLVLLAINPQRLEAELRYENCEGGEEQYPHVYGSIPLAAVQTVFPFKPDAAGTFALPTNLGN
ncbi:DUF952 domain-containing protein [Acaryochloris sp. CCMEE 5410]|uniref:DUF952 domain-containing protein n=1 Tax=Acaryochloris sp. CCMEE 5410 TaxID=310037 RepID=UPI000248380B|nr:DUF952 domain-containing protein [Acaryochloris sp. CCMEE 5410]KAI9132678.1 DUF952 domain-containing protein [Acaryochloris sp. CCMEE 5410]